MNRQRLLPLVLCAAALLTTRPAAAATVFSCSAPGGAISCTGTADTPEDVLLVPLTLSADDTVTIQTYGFGGGVNAAGGTIAAGGFDSLVALFSGMPTAATILTDGMSNPLASADNLSLYSPGCPPAGLVAVGTVAGVCGDNTLTATLTAGTYTLLLSDAAFIPIAVNPGGFSPFDLTDTSSNNYGSATGNGAYTDLSSGVFQTCVSLTDCNTDTGNFAVDITGLNGGSSPAVTPEPGTMALAVVALGAMFAARRHTRHPLSGPTSPVV
jgi:hypothetical protein